MRSKVFFFLILGACVQAENGFLPALEEKIENEITEYAGVFANWLQSFNDEHLGKTGMGRFLHYDEMKTKLKETKNQLEGRGVKKMGMAMMPLVFHIGATSTWMLLTTILAAKSLAVGLMLLVFKIAGSSAKLASFFTHLKHSKESHHDWTPQWPHFDHHSDHDHHIEHQPDHHGTISHHIPEWTPNYIPHYFHEYKNNEYHDSKNPEFHDNSNPEFHDNKNPEFHDNKSPEFHDNKNNEYHDFKDTHNFNGYKTITTHDLHGFGDDSHSDFNNFDGAKKNIDTKVG